MGYGLRRLVNMLGGDTNVVAQYDFFQGCVNSSGVVGTWGDARGTSGFGPSLTASGATRPTYDSTNSQVTNSGLTSLSTTAISGFDASKALALVLFCTQSTTATNVLASIRDSTPANTYLQIQIAVGPVVQAQGLGSDTPISSTAVPSATYRTLIGSVNGSTGINMDAPSKTRASATGTAPASLNCALNLFSATGTTSITLCSFKGTVVVKGVPAAALCTELTRFGTARYGCVAY